MTGSNQKRLADLRNVGKAMLADFEILGIATVDDPPLTSQPRCMSGLSS